MRKESRQSKIFLGVLVALALAGYVIMGTLVAAETPSGANNNNVEMSLAGLPTGQVAGGNVDYYMVVSNPSSTLPNISADARDITLTFYPAQAGNGTPSATGTVVGNIPYLAVGIAPVTVGPVTYPMPALDPGVTQAVSRAVLNGTILLGSGAGLPFSIVKEVSIGLEPGEACIHIEKSTNGEDADGPTGPYIPVGGVVTWTYNVTNCGSVALNITVTDSEAGVAPVYQSGDININGLLDLTEAWLYQATGIASAGQYANVGNATGIPPAGPPVSDDDPSHYFGSSPSIDLEKHVWDGSTWHDADTPTGPPLTSAQNPVVFRFVITNNDNVNLTNINLTDTDMSSFYTNQACTISATFPIPTLATSASVTVYGKLAWAQGQHSNNATATGTPPVGAPVSDGDPAHYFGSGPSIDVEKYVWNGSTWDDADTLTGPSLTAAQNPVIFKFEIDNNGNVNLTGVNLTDTDMFSFYTDQACTIAAVFPIGTLTPSDPPVTVYGKLTWAQGQHSDIATAMGTPPVGAPVSDTDPANYFGPSPSIDVEKYVWDGVTWHDADTPAGPSMTSAHNPVVFRFVITNNSGVNLTAVNLTDTDMFNFYTDQACTIAAVFPIATLTPSDPPVTVYGKLTWAQGQHTDTATATGTPPVGPPVSDSDPANYFGPPPSIDVEKYVWDGATWHDADTPTGPYLTSVQNPVIFRFVITNNCGVNLTAVNLTDTDMFSFYTDQACTIAAVFPIGTLTPSDPPVTVYGKLTWAEGQHSDTATAIGTPPVGDPVSDTDPAHYFGRSVTVGWETYPINKVRVLLPLIGLLAAVVVGAGLLVLRRRRTQS